MKPNYTKIFFAVIIFLFSVSLAYFTADYIEGLNYSGGARMMGIGLTMLSFGLLYAVVGVFLYRIMPVSLALLLSADVALIDALARNYEKIEAMVRVGIIGIVLVVLYLFAFYRCKDEVFTPTTKDLEQSSAHPSL